MQLGSLAFTISVFWKMRVLLAHHVQFCKRLQQEALEDVEMEMEMVDVGC